MKPVRVLIDGFFLGKPYGFGRFIYELCHALARDQGQTRFVVAVPEDCDSGLREGLPNFEWEVIPRSNFALWEQSVVPKAAHRLACDVIHFPYNTRAARTFGIPVVTTVHDLIFLHDRWIGKPLKVALASLYARACFGTLTAKSDLIVAVSRTTAALLAQRGIPSTVVYNTVDRFLAAPSHRAPNPRAPYLLHRGGEMEHRNTGRVIEAFAASGLPREGVRLCVLGLPDGDRRFPQEARASVEFLPRLSDDALADLYRNCAGVVATSLMEGFGLPIIEGFGFGVPVITSDIDPMKEVAGAAALLVNPYEARQIADAMTRVVKDERLAAALVAQGAVRYREFSGANICQRMVGLYRHAAGAEAERPPAT